MTKKFFVALLFVLTCISVKAECYAIYVGGDVNETEASVIEAQIVDRISQLHNVELFSREEKFLNLVNREHDYQLSGEVSPSQIRKIGAKYGVNYVISVVVNHIDDLCQMKAAVTNITTGREKASAVSSREVKSSQDLIALANRVAYNLSKKMETTR